MSKVLTFSTSFPKYHPQSGKPTHFVEQILNGLHDGHFDLTSLRSELKPYVNDFMLLDGRTQKLHTIRAGRRFKIGDKFSPRIWSGKPRHSNQLIFSEDLKVKTLLDFEIKNKEFFISGKSYGRLSPLNDTLQKLAKNDGLTAIELMQWFADKKGNQPDFEGQIISWMENINY